MFKRTPILSKDDTELDIWLLPTSCCLDPLTFRRNLSMVSIFVQILFLAFLNSFIWCLSSSFILFLESSFFLFSSTVHQLENELDRILSNIKEYNPLSYSMSNRMWWTWPFIYLLTSYLEKFRSWVSITFCCIETFNKLDPMSRLEPENIQEAWTRKNLFVQLKTKN